MENIDSRNRYSINFSIDSLPINGYGKQNFQRYNRIHIKLVEKRDILYIFLSLVRPPFPVSVGPSQEGHSLDHKSMQHCGVTPGHRLLSKKVFPPEERKKKFKNRTNKRRKPTIS